MDYLDEIKNVFGFHFFTFNVCQQQQKKEQYIALLERTETQTKFRRNHNFMPLCHISPEPYLTESS